MADIVTKEELETPRTAAEMREWVAQATERFSETRELRNAAREGKFFAKELTEEALPIALFARQYFNSSRAVWIAHIIGNQRYDALVDDRRESPGRVTFIEATASQYDYEDAKRMELLSAEGHAPSYGPVTAVGPRGRRTRLAAQSEAFEHIALRDEYIDRARRAVQRKAKNRYSAGTGLVIFVDDFTPISKPADHAELERVARTELVPLVDGREFCVLAFVGASGLFISFELTPAQ